MIKQMPNFAKLHSKWDNFKRATLKVRVRSRVSMVKVSCELRVYFSPFLVVISRRVLQTKSPTRPADFSFNRRNSAAYKVGLQGNVQRESLSRRAAIERSFLNCPVSDAVDTGKYYALQSSPQASNDGEGGNC